VLHPMMKCGCAAQGVRGTGAAKGAPVCVVHDCDEVAAFPPDLAGRMANCAYGDHAVELSAPEKLAFFEYRGPNSQWATEYCQCGYHRVAHDENRIRCRVGGFKERGPNARDVHYCGCRGWD
jgi:hypothetical protein